jgi:enterochelin esterase-like enzyme
MTWHEHAFASDALRGNPLGDPSERPLYVWAPDDGSDRYPSVYVLHAHMRSGPSWFNVEPFAASYPEDVDALQPEAIVVLVDGWTAVGGSQWIDSDRIGRYGTYLCEEVVPFVDGHYPTNGARGLQGKSSGGYGAIVNALDRPELFAAVAAHAPDALFEVTLAHGFPAAARELCGRHGGSTDAFWSSFAGLTSAGVAAVAEVGALALAFSDGELPFDVDTAELRPEVWERWLAHDPVRRAQHAPEAVQRLRGLWLDAGDADEYYADLGAKALRRTLLAAGLPEAALHFELFPGGHRGASWRYPLSLSFLVERLSSTL